MFVDVALPIPISKYFTYKIPEQINHKIAIGTIVIVPFGNKKLVGVVMDFPKQITFDINKIKNVEDVLFNDFTIPKYFLEFAKWISEYYCSTFGEAISLILPHGINKISKRKFKINGNINFPNSLDLSNNENNIFKVIKDLKIATVKQIQTHSKIKSINSILDGLINKKLIEFAESITTDRTKFEKVIENISIPNNYLVNGSSKKRIIEYLIKTNCNKITLKDLIKFTNSNLSSIKALQKENIFEISDVQISREINTSFKTEKKEIILNQEQIFASNEVIKSLNNKDKSVFLLHGITGSGKTEVYIEAMKHALENNLGIIFLVPEISLTPQTVSRLKNYFPNEITILHSSLSDGERFDSWNGIKNVKYKIVIGARSAIFAPIRNLGLIIVDEEHESSYKQYDSSPRYNSRDLAVVRGNKENATVILGSATPSIETYFNAKNGKYKLLELTKRIDKLELPAVNIIDLKQEQKNIFNLAKLKSKELGKNIFNETVFSISEELKNEIELSLNKNEGIILLQNRRGYAHYLVCSDCGTVERCSNCDLTLTYHLTKKHLRCHICGIVKKPPENCTKCKSFKLKYSSFGTQKIEEQLNSIFPNAKILRFDLDSTSKKNAHENLLQKFVNKEFDILLGTQMVAKGFDFPHVNLVGVINADIQMLLPDFRSSERTFQLITQVAGRSGRGEKNGKVLVQSFSPNNYSLNFAQTHNFKGFYESEIDFRKNTLYPPFVRLILIELAGLNEMNVANLSEEFAIKLKKIYSIGLILGPTPAAISKIKNKFRFHIIVKIFADKDPAGIKFKNILANLLLANTKKDVSISVDVDPQSLM